MESTCKFCQKFGGATGGNEIDDHVLFESENFVVVPSVGSIVPGWLLVVPRSHFLSVGSFDASRLQEFVGIHEIAAEALRDCFGPVAFFEHGAVRERESIGCGVDHAHSHIVATKFDAVAGVKAISKIKLEWRQVSGIQATRSYVAKQLPYVFVQPPSSGAWIGSGSVIESQLMRKVIAAYAGRPDSWDWKAHPFACNVRETVAKVEAWKAVHSTISAPS